MNFLDMLKQKALQSWQALQGSQQASQDWRQAAGQLQQKLQPTTPNPQMPAGQGVMQNIQSAIGSIPNASQMDANAQAMKQKIMQSQMMQHLMSLFGGQSAR